nr:hypothetical protein [uncultured Halomonas sp.]
MIESPQDIAQWRGNRTLKVAHPVVPGNVVWSRSDVTGFTHASVVHGFSSLTITLALRRPLGFADDASCLSSFALTIGLRRASNTGSFCCFALAFALYRPFGLLGQELCFLSLMLNSGSLLARY